MELAVNVTVTGIVLVFSMLLLLVFVLYLFGFVSVSISKSKEKKANKARAAALAEMMETSNNEEHDSFQETAFESEEEIVAVISAAVASMYSGTNVRPIIKSIKKASSRRSSWAKAGIADNTRVF